MTTAQTIPYTADTLIDEVVLIARPSTMRGLYLISDGKRVIVSPVVPPGFFKIAVKAKPHAANTEAMPCAA
ncbi:hypothetical protein [Pseudomonas sp.]|uniref:hypothetical protein n=1 Tax=Pseudomonas sp. TaxID=306 RepID=UPI003F3619E0